MSTLNKWVNAHRDTDVVSVEDRELARENERIRRLDAMQSRMSRHMQGLKLAGLVVDRRDAQWVRYRIRSDLPTHMRTLLVAALVEEVMA